MSNNVAAILNTDMAAILLQCPHSKVFLCRPYKESLLSFQSAIGSEKLSNLKHMAVILKSNMAAPDVNSGIAKMFLDIENIV